MQLVLSFATLAILGLAGLSTASPTPDGAPLERRFDGEAHFVNRWGEAPGTRYRYRFTGTTANDKSCGLAFLSAIRDNGGITNNWQCWYDGDLKSYVFDDTEVAGVAGASIISRGVSKVTGQSCDAAGFCP